MTLRETALLQSCTQEEFMAFLASYPRALERDVTGIFEPPLITYNDFTRAPQWPESVVASRFADGTGYQILVGPQ